MIDWRNFFKPEDFDSQSGIGDTDDISAIANSKLWAALQCENKVYGNMHDGGYHGKPTEWGIDNSSFDTHSAIITHIEKLQK